MFQKATKNKHKVYISAFFLACSLLACDAPKETPKPPQTTKPTQPNTTPAPPKPETTTTPKRAVEAASSQVASSQNTSQDRAQNAAPPTPKTPPKPRRILMVGDSMVWFLGEALKPMLEADGHWFKHRHKAGDSLRSWRYTGSRRMWENEARYKPDTIIVVMGSNDYWYHNMDVLLGPINRTKAIIGNRPCYWIGPPMWTEDTGIVKLLEEHAAPCRYFDSKSLTIGRKKDGIHPNEEGSQFWAEKVYAWLQQNPAEDVAAEVDAHVQASARSKALRKRVKTSLRTFYKRQRMREREARRARFKQRRGR